MEKKQQIAKTVSATNYSQRSQGCKFRTPDLIGRASLPKGFFKYGLTLHPEKTPLVNFKKPVDKAEGALKPESFNLLWFTHYWAKSGNGYWVSKRKTAKDRLALVPTIFVWGRNSHYFCILSSSFGECANIFLMFLTFFIVLKREMARLKAASVNIMPKIMDAIILPPEINSI